MEFRDWEAAVMISPRSDNTNRGIASFGYADFSFDSGSVGDRSFRNRESLGNELLSNVRYGISSPDKTNDTVGVSAVENIAVFQILHGDVDIFQHLAIQRESN